MSSYSLLLSTLPTKQAAKKLARLLLSHRLAACINIVNAVESYFWWQGRVNRASEVLIMVKTKTSLVNQGIRFMKSHHPYEVPEIIAFEIKRGWRPYLDWIGKSVKRG